MGGCEYRNYCRALMTKLHECSAAVTATCFLHNVCPICKFYCIQKYIFQHIQEYGYFLDMDHIDQKYDDHMELVDRGNNTL